MPELPEVETTRLGLLPRLQSRTLTRIVVRNPRLRWPVPADLASRLTGQVLGSLDRRGKYLLFDFGSTTQIVHLGMSGSLRFAGPTNPPRCTTMSTGCSTTAPRSGCATRAASARYCGPTTWRGIRYWHTWGPSR